MDISDLREMMQTELEAVHTTLAGKIVSWDGSRAVVRPALPVNNRQTPPPVPPAESTNEVPAYVDDSLPEARPELEVPRVIGVDAEKDEIDLPDFLR